jgi:uncharacterized protein
VRGAVGALVLVDTNRLGISFPAINYFEQDTDGLPFVVCINQFNGQLTHSIPAVREALQRSSPTAAGPAPVPGNARSATAWPGR